MSSVVPDSNYVSYPGAVNVAPGGGGASSGVHPTAVGQVLTSALGGNGLLTGVWALPLGQTTTGSASTKGSFTLASGTHAQIATTAAVTGSVIVYTTVTLGTVTVASSFLTTIQSGVGFTPVASDNTDTSVVNWAIVA